MAASGIVWILLSGAAGGLIGTALGASRTCQTGTCPLTANPLRGGVVGTLLGLVFALSAGVGTGPPSASSSGSAGDSLAHLTTQNFDDGVAKGVTLVDFWSPGCGPCRHQLPILAELSSEVDGKFRIVKVDVSKERDLAERFRIRNIPTLIFFRDGIPIDTRVGLHSKIEVMKAFSELPK